MRGIKSTKRRLEFATQNVLNRPVMTMERSYWKLISNENAFMTQVQSLSGPFKNVMHEAQVVAVTACGFQTSSAGIYIARRDEKDAPYIYNIDHYTVVQTLCMHSAYDDILQRAGVANSPQLQNCLGQYVFVVKNNPSETQDHWCEELPDIMRNACLKNELP